LAQPLGLAKLAREGISVNDVVVAAIRPHHAPHNEVARGQVAAAVLGHKVPLEQRALRPGAVTN
jgi:hypothetical protein